jgi:hypothetical protein
MTSTSLVKLFFKELKKTEAEAEIRVMTTAGRRRSPQPGRDLDHRVGATDGLAQDHSHLSRLVVVCIGECHSVQRG